jgi:hypothetical protein
MLAAGGEAAYISEPLNVLHRPGVMQAAVKHWYPYLCPQTEAAYLPALRRTLTLRYSLRAELPALRSRKDLLRMLRDGSTFALGRLRRQRPLIKDPFAVFSIPWFRQRLDCAVVVTVRNPAAFASSLKRLDWPFQLEDLLAQPALMADWLEPFRAEMESMPAEDLIGRASLLWKMIYHVVAELRQQDPNLLVVRHEDLSVSPLEGYRDLYAALHLSYTPRARAAVVQSSKAENPKEISTQAVHATRLDSLANLLNWQHRMQPAEIARVRQLTGPVAAQYYPEMDWG